jgi:hypothetical protein
VLQRHAPPPCDGSEGDGDGEDDDNSDNEQQLPSSQLQQQQSQQQRLLLQGRWLRGWGLASLPHCHLDSQSHVDSLSLTGAAASAAAALARADARDRTIFSVLSTVVAGPERRETAASAAAAAAAAAVGTTAGAGVGDNDEDADGSAQTAAAAGSDESVECCICYETMTYDEEVRFLVCFLSSSLCLACVGLLPVHGSYRF